MLRLQRRVALPSRGHRAQAARAELIGQVTDQSAAAIENASVTLTQLATGAVRRTVTSADGFFLGFVVQRPNLVGDPNLPSNQRSAARWFDTSAFEMAARFALGTSSRNPVRGPASLNVDLVILRRVAIGCGAIECRAEVFNLLNTPPLGAPDTVLGTAGFGSIASAGDPRVVQLAPWKRDDLHKSRSAAPDGQGAKSELIGHKCSDEQRRPTGCPARE